MHLFAPVHLAIYLPTNLLILQTAVHIYVIHSDRSVPWRKSMHQRMGFD